MFEPGSSVITGLHAFSQSLWRDRAIVSAGMIGKFMMERRETTKKKLFVVSSSGCAMEDLQRCLMSRNIDTNRDEKQKKTVEEIPERKMSDGCLMTIAPQVTTPKDIIRNLTRRNDDKSEILIEGTALNCQNLVQNTDGAKMTTFVSSSVEEQAPVYQNISSTSKGESQADGNAVRSERSSLNSPELSSNTAVGRSDKENGNEESLLVSAKAAPRNLDPCPWKEIWSVLQDRSRGSCLSTKNMEFGRDMIETPFSTRTNPYSRQRREKPQRIPPLYNTRKALPTTHGNKEKIPSFDDVVVFNTVFKDVRRDQGIAGSAHEIECEECMQLKNAKNSDVQIENVEGHKCGRYECKKEKTIGLPNVTCPPATDRYKSKFRVRLLPLVAKSDSLPNLTSSSTSVPSELIVTAPTNVVCSNENVHLDCFKSADRKTNFVSESELVNKFGQNRSMSLDSVFSMESLAAYQAKKNSSKGIKVQGFQVLPDIKHAESKKRDTSLKQASDEAWSVAQMPNVITLPWKCT